ncbi:MAG: nuclear transport factor 2 family protein [Acidobacteriota bacterium]
MQSLLDAFPYPKIDASGRESCSPRGFASVLALLLFCLLAVGPPAAASAEEPAQKAAEQATPREAATQDGIQNSLQSNTQKNIAAQVKKLLSTQAEAWSRGDLEAFVSAYAPQVRFVSPSGITRGRQQVLERYQRRYPDAAAMGTLTLEVEEVRTAADGQVAHVAARWLLEYDDREPASGYTLLALSRGAEGRWEIIEDASM